MKHRIFAMRWSGHVVPDSLSASQCNLEYPRLVTKTFISLEKTSSDPHQPHKRPIFFYLQINYRSKTRSEGGGRGFYDEAWTSCKHATKAGKKPWTPALKRESSSSPLSTHPGRQHECAGLSALVTVVWCRWQFGTAHPREKAPTSGQSSCSWWRRRPHCFIAAELLLSVNVDQNLDPSMICSLPWWNWKSCTRLSTKLGSSWWIVGQAMTWDGCHWTTQPLD